jgi:hypothetical protein
VSDSWTDPEGTRLATVLQTSVLLAQIVQELPSPRLFFAGSCEVFAPEEASAGRVVATCAGFSIWRGETRSDGESPESARTVRDLRCYGHTSSITRALAAVTGL